MTTAATEQPEPIEVGLFYSQWVSGMRATGYFGPISVELFLADTGVEDRGREWSKAELELLERLRDKARALGANAVVSMEVEMDPFARDEGKSGLRLYVSGTAKKLEKLF